MRIPLDKIRVPEVRASARMDPEQHEIFTATVEKYGVIQDPVVRPLPDGSYELIAGKSRLDAQRDRGESEIECKIVDAGDKDALIMHLAENLARGKSDPVNEAKVLQKFIDQGGTIEEAAKLTGHTPEWVKFRLSIARLPEEYKESLQRDEIKLGHVALASQLRSPEEMAHALDLSRKLKWPISTLENYVKQRFADYEAARLAKESPEPPPLPSMEEAAERVRFYTCAGCNRQVDEILIRSPPICEACYKLVRYATSQLGPPQEAMQKIYDSWSHYQRFLEFQAQQEALKKAEESKRQAPSTPEQREGTQLPP